MRALTIEGCVIGFFVILNGIYVVAFPPGGDEPQGYAIAAIGIFIVIVTMHLDRNAEGPEEFPPQIE